MCIQIVILFLSSSLEAARSGRGVTLPVSLYPTQEQYPMHKAADLVPTTSQTPPPTHTIPPIHNGKESQKRERDGREGGPVAGYCDRTGLFMANIGEVRNMGRFTARARP